MKKIILLLWLQVCLMATSSLVFADSELVIDKAYIPFASAKEVLSLNIKTDELESSLPADNNLSYGLATSPDGQMVVSLDFMGDKVHFINTSDGTLLKTLDIDSPMGATFSQDGKTLYIVSRDVNKLVVINMVDNYSKTEYKLDYESTVPILSDQKLYVINDNASNIDVFDLDDLTQKTSLSIGSFSGWKGAISPNYTKLYISGHFRNDIKVVDLSNNNTLSTITTGANVTGLEVSPDGSKLYVAVDDSDNNNDGVKIVSTTDSSIIATIDDSLNAQKSIVNPSHLSLSPDGLKAYVTNYGTGTSDASISVIDLTSNQVIKVIPTTSQLNPGDTQQIQYIFTGFLPTTAFIQNSLPKAPSINVSNVSDSQLTLSWNPVNGASSYDVYIGTNPGIQTFNTTTSNTSVNLTGLNDNTTYYLSVKAANPIGVSSRSNLVSVTTLSSSPAAPSAPSSNEPEGTVYKALPFNHDIEGYLDDTSEKIGRLDIKYYQGKLVSLISLNDDQLMAQIESDTDYSVLRLPVGHVSTQNFVGQLNGQILKEMGQKDMMLQIDTDKLIYKLPTRQIDIDAIASQMGHEDDLENILIDIEIDQASETTKSFIQNKMDQNDYEMLIDPLIFKISAIYQDQVYPIEKFNHYIQKYIQLPDEDVDYQELTGVLIKDDGTITSVPTQIVTIENHRYARLSTLEEGNYSLMTHPVKVLSNQKHWSSQFVDEMASKLIISDPQLFKADEEISGANFIDYLNKTIGSTLLEEKDFDLNDSMTRQEAGQLINQVMTLLESDYSSDNGHFSDYRDIDQIDANAFEALKNVVEAGIMNGKTETTLNPTDHITYAEAATLMSHVLALIENLQ